MSKHLDDQCTVAVRADLPKNGDGLSRSLRQALILLMCLIPAGRALALEGVVRDGTTGKPIAQATVVSGASVVLTDSDGHFDIGPAASISARAPGFKRYEQRVREDEKPVIDLAPFRPKAIYLSAFGIGNSELRGDALRLIEQTELNALVIDIKGDRGIVPYRSAAVAASGLAQTVITVADMPALMKSMRERGIYLIARVVVFKDEPLATARPHWAVHDANGAVWKDREGLAWIDPFNRKAWERSLALAEEAAVLGFDEVQFDYLRFPDAAGLKYCDANDEDRRVSVIDAFLSAARARLARYNVFISVDIFGYVTWNTNDTQIGQRLEDLAGRVDYLSPMLYPSGFGHGIPGYRTPMDAPFEIVKRSLQRARARTNLPGVRWRPWLQAFRDYAFDHRDFGEAEIRAQIEAAESEDTDGWMLWNPRNRYRSNGLATGPTQSRSVP